MLKELSKLIFEYFNIKKLYSKVKETNYYKGKTLVINSIKSDRLIFAVEVLMAAIFSKNGATCYIVIDDGNMAHHDIVQYKSEQNLKILNPNNLLKYRLRRRLLEFLARWAYDRNVLFLHTSEIDFLYRQENLNETYREILNRNALSSCRRYFQIDAIDMSNPLHSDYYKKSFNNAILSIKVGMYTDKVIKANIFITSHAIYSCWGPAYDFLKNNSSVRTIVYGTNTYVARELYFSTDKLQVSDRTTEITSFLDNKLNESEINKTVNYLDRRINKQEKDTRVYYGKNFESFPSIDNSKPLVMAFPNVIWDGDIEERNILFNGVVDWLLTTIDFYRENPNVNFAIRFHPAESTWYKGVKPLETIIREKVPDIDFISNLTLISSSTNIELYDIIKEKVTLSLVYDGMLAIECGYMSKPVILCGRGRFTSNNFAYEPKNKKEYFDLISDPNKAKDRWNEEANKTLAIKLCYWYIFGCSFKFPSLNNDHSDFGTNLLNCTEDNITLDKNLLLGSLFNWIVLSDEVNPIDYNG